MAPSPDIYIYVWVYPRAIHLPMSFWQRVEELAMGDDGWEYEEMDGRSKCGEIGKGIGGEQHDGGEQAAKVPEIWSIIAKLARREDR